MCATLTLTCFSALLLLFQDTLLIVYGHWSWYLQTRAKCTRPCNELVPNVSPALPALHAFSGCDSTSSFLRKRNTVPCKLMRSSQPSSDSILAVGVSNHVTDDILSAVEQFICVTWLDACVMASWTIKLQVKPLLQFTIPYSFSKWLAVFNISVTIESPRSLRNEQ